MEGVVLGGEGAAIGPAVRPNSYPGRITGRSRHSFFACVQATVVPATSAARFHPCGVSSSRSGPTVKVLRSVTTSTVCRPFTTATSTTVVRTARSPSSVHMTLPGTTFLACVQPSTKLTSILLVGPYPIPPP